MLKIEPHKILPNCECIVWYEDGQSKAVVYVDPVKGLKVLCELDVKVEVSRRTVDPMGFERIL